MKNNPLISIVTVVYNDADGLKKTIQSVLSQTYKNIEYIIIDGGSTDGTVEVIQKYKSYIDYWVSEPDKGIYDAMNKGSKQATGDSINFLNAGDYYIDSMVLESLLPAFKKHNSKAIFGRALNIAPNSQWYYPSIEVSKIPKWLKRYMPNHQAIFFPREFYTQHKYDLSLKITADMDYKLYAKNKCGYYFVDKTIVVFAIGGVSSQNGNLSLILQRIKESIKRNLRHQDYVDLFRAPVFIMSKYIMYKFFGEESHRIILKARQYFQNKG